MYLDKQRGFLSRTLKGEVGEHQKITEMLGLKHFIEGLLASYQQN